MQSIITSQGWAKNRESEKRLVLVLVDSYSLGACVKRGEALRRRSKAGSRFGWHRVWIGIPLLALGRCGLACIIV